MNRNHRSRSGLTAIEDWVRLAIDRQRLEGCKAVFWLDRDRAHDRELLAYVEPMLEAAGLGIAFHAKPRAALAADAHVRHGDLTALLWAQGVPRRHWSR